jgi:hypothetical protein
MRRSWLAKTISRLLATKLIPRTLARSGLLAALDPHFAESRQSPSGDPTPSRADVEMTRQIAEIAKPLGVAVHEYIIVGRNGHASLKGLGLM